MARLGVRRLPLRDNIPGTGRTVLLATPREFRANRRAIHQPIDIKSAKLPLMPMRMPMRMPQIAERGWPTKIPRKMVALALAT